jgi:hypothetical protein
MRIGAIKIPITAQFYQELAAALPTECQCAQCGFVLKVNPAHCLQRGWPKCCGQTMTLGAAAGVKPKQRTIKMITWKCHLCGEERPDAKISVLTTDVSAEHGLPVGTWQQNVRYCNDRPGCIEGAKTKRLIPPKKA